MELDKYEEKQIAQISPLLARSNELQATAYKMMIGDDVSLAEANALVKEINAHKKDVQEKRLEITKPMNAVVNALITKEKEILLPLEEGKNKLSEKILNYSAEVERKRKEEEDRVQGIVDDLKHFVSSDLSTVEEIDMNGAGLKEAFGKLPEADQNHPTIKLAFMNTVNTLSEKKATLEEEARQAAERARQAEEQKRLDAEAKKMSDAEAEIARERNEIEAEKRKLENDKLAIEKEKEDIARRKELQEAEKAANKLAKGSGKKIKTNAVTSTKFEITDENAVARMYCSPDESKIREAIKNGVLEIGGVRIYEETKVR